MIRRITRVTPVLIFGMLGLISLVVADKVNQCLCAHIINCTQAAVPCPIDVCAGDARLNMLRMAVWCGPTVVFGVSAFLFGRRSRPLHAWLALLATLVVAHAVIMAAAVATTH